MTTAAKKAERAPEPVVSTSVTFDGLRAIDTTDGEAGESRDATFAEQVAALAPQILEQAVGIVHDAQGGSVSTKENVVMIVLEPR